MYHHNTRDRSKSPARSSSGIDPFEMIDKDLRLNNEEASPLPQPRNRSRGGAGKRRLIEEIDRNNSSDDDDEMLLGRKNHEDEYNSSDIDEENADDGDIIRPLLSNITIDFKYFWTQFKSVGPKLVPFLKTLGMYFVIFIPVDRPSWFAMLIKCLPVASLALFVLLHGVSMKDQHTYARRILAGLLFSCLGDALLVWPSYFVEGMTAFGAAMLLYILAFGFEPPNWTLGVVIYAMTSIGLGILMPGLMTAEPAMMIGVPIYVVLLTTMVWRALAQIQYFDDLWSWSKLCSCFGGFFFVISDTVLGMNKFYVEVPGSQALIMSAYFIAQFGMALSIVNPKGRDDGAKREAAYLEQQEEDTEVRGGTSKKRSNVSWMEILESTAPGTKTLEISPEDQREAELLYY